MARPKPNSSASASTANLGFEAKLWLAADKLRNNMDAAEYKHVVLGLIFLKYISDTFEEHRAKLLAGEGDYAGANPEDPDEYKAENVFWVPADARWSHLQANAKQPTIGKVVDDAMVAIERDNPRLKGVLPKDYARPGLDKHRLGELIDLIATIDLIASNQPSPQPSPSGRGSEESGEKGQETILDRLWKITSPSKPLPERASWEFFLSPMHRPRLRPCYRVARQRCGVLQPSGALRHGPRGTHGDAWGVFDSCGWFAKRSPGRWHCTLPVDRCNESTAGLIEHS